MCDDEETTEPDVLVKIYNEIAKQNNFIELFDKRLRSLESSISLVLNAYTGHSSRLSDIEDRCEKRGRVMSKLLSATPIPTEK